MGTRHRANARERDRRLSDNDDATPSEDADVYSTTAAAVLEGLATKLARAAKWVHTLHRYEDHWLHCGHAPRENTRARHTLTADERRLGEWGRYQRRFEDQLNAYQRARLDVSPAFEWDPLGRHWRERLAACARFVDHRGALPRLSAVDRDEFGLARVARTATTPATSGFTR